MIPVNQPRLDGNEKRYLVECIDSGWISSEGRFVTDLERHFADKVGRRHAVAVNSGTAALEAALVALGLSPGDEVIIPTFTIICCVSAVLRAGATPVLVDCDPDTWNMDVSAIETKITKRTKAIMAVHIYGLPVDMDPILHLAERYNLIVIEDAAEAIGLRYKGRLCGSFGDISAMSFYANKHVTTGEGGMIFTDDDEIAEHCRSLRNLCFNPQRRFVHEELGWNLRMCNLQAAIGLAQLERLDESVARKRWMGHYYQKTLADIPEIQLPLDSTPYADNVYWVFGIVIKEGVPIDGDELARRLQAAGVQTRPFFWPMHTQPVFKAMGLFNGESYPVAERIARKGLYLPCGLALTESEILQVSAALHNVFANEEVEAT
jgi:perosamine synthetase